VFPVFARPELKLRPCIRQLQEHDQALLLSAAMVRDCRTVLARAGVPAGLAKMDASHYRRRPDNGSQLLPPSGRLHGFARRVPDWLAGALRKALDSLTFSHHGCTPLCFRELSTRRESKKTAHHRHTLVAQNRSAQRLLFNVIMAAPTASATPMTQHNYQSNYPNAVCATSPTTPSTRVY
jgi:hypothetical protein